MQRGCRWVGGFNPNDPTEDTESPIWGGRRGVGAAVSTPTIRLRILKV